ncbi:RNA polymerase sigma factor [Actinokineospora enzanensis]|uniref:RNA polymerase sigma factor n=1 Tax=Actinokineospora enzanensis TaxID=155975 RepID=UPI00037CE340|nr:DUF6596 domain-containing protein [Actinokineospora enzanensis]
MDVEAVFRAEWPRVLASLAKTLGNADLAEEAAQEAFAIAAGRWEREGVPENPRGWLVVTGRNRAVDRLRREKVLAEKIRSWRPAEVVPYEQLDLMLMCCHPVLPVESQVALTLRSLGGLSTAEVARAFLVAEETMKRRLSRARARIRVEGLAGADPVTRLPGVFAVLYLIFNQGYGDGRVELSAEAIHLARTLCGVVDGPEAAALLALMLLHDSRKRARVRDGVFVPLDEQDRELWDSAEIEEGRALLDTALRRGARGVYAVQAAIAAAQTDPVIDWGAVATLYARLGELTGSPVVELNRAVAVAELSGPEAGLAVLDGLDLDGYRYFHSTRGDFLRRLGDLPRAAAEYRRALDLSVVEAERGFLSRRLREVGGS